MATNGFSFDVVDGIFPGKRRRHRSDDTPDGSMSQLSETNSTGKRRHGSGPFWKRTSSCEFKTNIFFDKSA